VIGRPVGSVGEDVLKGLKIMALPKEVTIIPEGDMKYQTEAFGSLGIAFLASILFVYLIMVALYDSYLYPFVVLFSIPLAIIGALLCPGIDHAIADNFLHPRDDHAGWTCRKKCDPSCGFHEPDEAEGHKTKEALGTCRESAYAPDPYDHLFNDLRNDAHSTGNRRRQ